VTDRRTPELPPIEDAARRDLRVVRETLRSSVAIVERNPSQLTGQLLARLGPPGEPGSGYDYDGSDERIDPLLRGLAGDVTGPWLRPVRRSLPWYAGRSTSAGTHGAAVRALTSVTVDGNERLVSGGDDGRVLLWDPTSGPDSGPERPPIAGFATGMPVLALAVSADHIAAGDTAGQVHQLEVVWPSSSPLQGAASP